MWFHLAFHQSCCLQKFLVGVPVIVAMADRFFQAWNQSSVELISQVDLQFFLANQLSEVLPELCHQTFQLRRERHYAFFRVLGL
jgi:ABC-type tungstate transport system substrate-binding protein